MTSVLRVSSAPSLARAAQQISLGKNQQTSHPQSSPIRIQLPADIGFRHCLLAHPLYTPYGASHSFDRCAHLWRLPHIPWRASQRLASLWLSLGSPQQCTCPFSVGFPLPGPRVWTCTSYLLFMRDEQVSFRTRGVVSLEWSRGIANARPFCQVYLFHFV